MGNALTDTFTDPELIKKWFDAMLTHINSINGDNVDASNKTLIDGFYKKNNYNTTHLKVTSAFNSILSQGANFWFGRYENTLLKQPGLSKKGPVLTIENERIKLDKHYIIDDQFDEAKSILSWSFDSGNETEGKIQLFFNNEDSKKPYYFEGSINYQSEDNPYNIKGTANFTGNRQISLKRSSVKRIIPAPLDSWDDFEKFSAIFGVAGTLITMITFIATLYAGYKFTNMTFGKIKEKLLGVKVTAKESEDFFLGNGPYRLDSKYLDDLDYVIIRQKVFEFIKLKKIVDANPSRLKEMAEELKQRYAEVTRLIDEKDREEEENDKGKEKALDGIEESTSEALFLRAATSILSDKEDPQISEEDLKKFYALQFVLSLKDNPRLAKQWGDLLSSIINNQNLTINDKKSKIDNFLIDQDYEQDSSDVDTKDGANTDAEHVLDIIKAPWWEEYLKSSKPNAASDRFVQDVLTDQILADEYTAKLDEYGVAISKDQSTTDDNELLDKWLKAKGYDCSTTQVVASFYQMRNQNINFWAGNYQFTVISPENSASVQGPKLILTGDDGVNLDCKQLVGYTYSEGVLKWVKEPEGYTLTNKTEGEITFSRVTKASRLDDYIGNEFSGTITDWKTYSGKCKFEGRAWPADKPLPVSEHSSPSERKSDQAGVYIGIVTSGLFGLSIIAALAYKLLPESTWESLRKKFWRTLLPKEIQIEGIKEVPLRREFTESPTEKSRLDNLVQEAQEIADETTIAKLKDEIEQLKTRVEELNKKFAESTSGDPEIDEKGKEVAEDVSGIKHALAKISPKTFLMAAADDLSDPKEIGKSLVESVLTALQFAGFGLEPPGGLVLSGASAIGLSLFGKIFNIFDKGVSQVDLMRKLSEVLLKGVKDIIEAEFIKRDIGNGMDVIDNVADWFAGAYRGAAKAWGEGTGQAGDSDTPRKNFQTELKTYLEVDRGFVLAVTTLQGNYNEDIIIPALQAFLYGAALHINLLKARFALDTTDERNDKNENNRIGVNDVDHFDLVELLSFIKHYADHVDKAIGMILDKIELEFWKLFEHQKGLRDVPEKPKSSFDAKNPDIFYNSHSRESYEDYRLILLESRDPKDFKYDFGYMADHHIDTHGYRVRMIQGYRTIDEGDILNQTASIDLDREIQGWDMTEKEIKQKYVKYIAKHFEGKFHDVDQSIKRLNAKLDKEVFGGNRDGFLKIINNFLIVANKYKKSYPKEWSKLGTKSKSQAQAASKPFEKPHTPVAGLISFYQEATAEVAKEKLEEPAKVIVSPDQKDTDTTDKASSGFNL
jgi:hypothetical protein